MHFVIPPPPTVTLPVLGGGVYPLRNIYCVGRNYAAHAAEMGSDPAREPPFFFTKSAQAILPNGAVMPYPPATADLQPEVELVVALQSGGRDLSENQAQAAVFGYAVGLDMTRRDLQREAKAHGRPWDMSKSFDHAAPLSALTPKSRCGSLAAGEITLEVNGALRQHGDLREMIWPVPQILIALSQLVSLHPGDLVFTGTPAGVAPVQRGDRLEGRIAGLETLRITIG